jgi:acyl carrier protein
MDEELDRLRGIVIRALQASSALGTHSPEFAAQLADPAADVRFDEVEADSLARMEVCIQIELETGLSLSTEELLAHPSVNQLARRVQILLAQQR